MTGMPRIRARCLAPGDRRLAEWPADAATRTVHFLRHGESLHQRRAAAEALRGIVCRCHEFEARGETPTACPYWEPSLVDAPLTEAGRRQVIGIAGACDAQVVLAAASMRTLETATLAFPSTGGSVAGRVPPILALEELRSRVGAHRHTQRRSRAELAASFPDVDFTHVVAEMDPLWTPATESRRSLDARAESFLRILFARPERDLAVITHFTVFLALFQRRQEGWVIGAEPLPPGAADEPLLDCAASDDPVRLRRPVEIGEVRTILLRREGDSA